MRNTGLNNFDSSFFNWNAPVNLGMVSGGGAWAWREDGGGAPIELAGLVGFF